jgi:hypothetical protein
MGVAKNLNVGGIASFSAQPIFSSLTASSAVATDASKGLVSVTNTGTGNNVLATSPTLVTPALGTPASGVMTNVTGINYDGYKNRLINGAMVFDQRNAGASVSPSGTAYTLDRWKTGNSVDSKYTVQQNAGSVTPPVGFTNYLGVTSSSAYTVGSTEFFLQYQVIEGYNIADLAWGTANAKTVTLSFQVYSSLTGTFGGTLLNSAANRCFVFSYSIPTANTWTTISVTIAGDTTGTWLTTNGQGINVFFSLGSGSSVSGTAGSWGSTLYRSVTGATSVVGTNGATFYITGVQLEKGSTATSFDYRPYGTELALCQRYYQLAEGFGGTSYVTTKIGIAIQFKTEMRTSPSTSATAAVQITYSGVADYTQSSANAVIISGRVSSRGVYLECQNFTGLTNSIFHQQNVSVNNAAIALSAEL